MTMDILKGHTYKFSPYQYMEVNSHIDHEMQWIVNGYVSDFSKKIVGGKYRVYSLFETVARAVAQVIAEREEFSYDKIIIRRIADSMFSAYQAYTGPKGDSQYEITDTFLVYAVNATIAQIRYLRA